MNIQRSIPACRTASERNDCTVIALSHVTGLPYGVCHNIATEAGRKAKQGCHTRPLVEASSKYAVRLTDMRVPTAAITIAGLAYCFPQGRYYATIKGHAFALVDGKIIDNGGITGNAFITSLHRLDSEPVKNLADELFG